MQIMTCRTTDACIPERKEGSPNHADRCLFDILRAQRKREMQTGDTNTCAHQIREDPKRKRRPSQNEIAAAYVDMIHILNHSL